jgi:2-dehydropantoate 2-reductase
MRVLVVGAGALGGYFGARLLQAGIDVTFLVRPHRAEQLRSGLTVKSPSGDFELPAPPTVLASQLQTGFDLILLSCKAYDLDSAMDSLAPAVDSNTTILPLLNGMKHLVRLRERFGRIEADQIVGDLLECARGKVPESSRVQMAYLHLKTYEQRRARDQSKVVSSG